MKSALLVASDEIDVLPHRMRIDNQYMLCPELEPPDAGNPTSLTRAPLSARQHEVCAALALNAMIPVGSQLPGRHQRIVVGL